MVVAFAVVAPGGEAPCGFGSGVVSECDAGFNLRGQVGRVPEYELDRGVDPDRVAVAHPRPVIRASRRRLLSRLCSFGLRPLS